LVKTLQKQTEELKRQLENEKHDTALLLEALKEQTRYKDHSDIVAPSLPQEKIYPLEGLKEMKARLDKLEASPAQMRPLIKTEYTFDNSEALDPPSFHYPYACYPSLTTMDHLCPILKQPLSHGVV